MMAKLENIKFQIENNLSKLEKLREAFSHSCKVKLSQEEYNDLDDELGYLVGDFCNIILGKNKISKELIKCDSNFAKQKDGIKFVYNRKKHQKLSVVITENSTQSFTLDRSKLNSEDKILGGNVKWSESLLNSSGDRDSDKQKLSFETNFKDKNVFYFIDTLIKIDKICLSNSTILNIN